MEDGKKGTTTKTLKMRPIRLTRLVSYCVVRIRYDLKNIGGYIEMDVVTSNALLRERYEHPCVVLRYSMTPQPLICNFVALPDIWRQ